MTQKDYHTQLKEQVNILHKILNEPHVDSWDWRHLVHIEVCKLTHIIGEEYDGDIQ